MGAGQMDVDAHPDYYCTGFFLGEPGKAVHGIYRYKEPLIMYSLFKAEFNERFSIVTRARMAS